MKFHKHHHNNEQTPLHYSAEYGCYEIFEYIMKNSRNKNPMDRNDTTPLHLAAKNGRLEVCKLILANLKKDFNPPNKFKETPLMLAKKFGHTSICALIASMYEYYQKRN